MKMMTIMNMLKKTIEENDKYFDKKFINEFFKFIKTDQEMEMNENDIEANRQDKDGRNYSLIEDFEIEDLNELYKKKSLALHNDNDTVFA
ncbi:27094_t:CDS:2 [Dentiscutata erythropus]|uniref:27094_t:CDS:1 n=1 Tax=Dentiscutata erythropus TaxID=1348616 RepID=A0A9N9HS44_9GLOM|nr:27094_t:CDS:2 [Dentiscutata erythropus]